MKPKNSFRSQSQDATGTLCPLIIFVASMIAVSADTFIWDGGSLANANSATPENWEGNVAPVGGSDLVFSATSPIGTTVTWDSPNIRTMTFDASSLAYTFSGPQGLQIVTPGVDSIANNSTNTQSFTSQIRPFFNGSKALNASTGDLQLSTVAFRLDGMADGQTNTLTLTGAANGTISGGISETGIWSQDVSGKSNALNKAGSGTWTLEGANTFTGLTTVSAGILELANPGGESLLGGISLAGGRLFLGSDEQIADTTAPTWTGTSNSRLVLTGFNETVGGLESTGATGTANIVEAAVDGVTESPAELTLDVATAATYNYGGYVRDAAGAGGTSPLSLVKNGEGTQNLSGAGAIVSYSGPTTINGGLLEYTGNNSVAANSEITVNAGGTLKFGTAGTTGIRNKTISGDGNVIKSGTGTVEFGVANSYTGTTSINGGKLLLSNPDAIAAASSVNVAGVGTLQMKNGGSFAAFPLELNGNGNTGVDLEFPTGNNTSYGINSAITLDGGAIVRFFGFNNNYDFNGALGGTIPEGGENEQYLRFRTEGNNSAGNPHTITLNTASNYTGKTIFQALTQQGVLKLGVDNALPATTSLIMLGGTNSNTTATLDLAGYDQTFASFFDSQAPLDRTIVTNSGSPATLRLNNYASNIKSLVTGDLTLQITNANAGTPALDLARLNTFTGGLTLLDGSGLDAGVGTRLIINDVITGTPFGTGPITIGEAPADKAGIMLQSVASNTIPNNLVINTALGTDVIGMRVDSNGNVLSGTINANLADATFSAGGTAAGEIALTGQVTGIAGLRVAATAGAGGGLTVTLNNPGTANNYQGDTTLNSSKDTIVLAASNQIPNGAGTGNVVNNGTLNLGGFNETINGLSGTGTVDGSSGNPTLTIGANDATGDDFPGVITNTAGTLSLVKIGTGTQTLSGVNTYTGDTIVSAGVLAVSGNSIANTGKLDIDGGMLLIPSPASNEVVDTLFFNGVQQDPGVYGSSSAAGPGVITNDTYFDVAGTGTLTVNSGPGGTYATWLAANPPATGFIPDSDNDGVPNGVENVLGTDPNAYSAGLTEVSATTTSVTYKHTLNPSIANDVSYTYEWSADLGEWKDSGVANTAGTLGTIVASAPDAGVVTVTTTQSGTASAKLFTRIKVENP